MPSVVTERRYQSPLLRTLGVPAAAKTAPPLQAEAARAFAREEVTIACPGRVRSVPSGDP